MRPVTRARERGVVLVVVALCLTVLMIFAAFAIDFGAARTARRKGQSTVDGGTLAGGQLLVSDAGTLTGADPDVVADEVIEVTHLNLTDDGALSDAGSLTLEEWRARFVTCTDPDRDEERFPNTSDVSDCISFNSQMTRIRVRLPDLNVGTYFATVIGVDSLDVHAVAEADLVPDGAAGGVLPFGLLGGVGGPEVCLKSGSQPDLPPCNGPASGNFGTVDVKFFGNPVLGTTEACTGIPNTRLPVNIAAGIDHRLSVYVPGTTPVANEDVVCPDLAVQPNQVDGLTGLRTDTLDQGLIDGTSLDDHPIPGRLTGTPWATRLVRTGSDEVDDEPLWSFIDPTLTEADAPVECIPSITAITTKADMVTCINAYVAGSYTADLFGLDADGIAGPDILRSPRLAWVPEFHQTAWGSGESDPYEVAGFRPVFLQTLYFCQGNSCISFEPGEAGPGLPVNANRAAEALTALLLPGAALPQAVHDEGPGGDPTYELVLRR
jgi:hypothetical protein